MLDKIVFGKKQRNRYSLGINLNKNVLRKMKFKKIKMRYSEHRTL